MGRLRHTLGPVFLAAVAAGLLLTSPARAAECGYGNYVPGAYGDFGLAPEPPAKLTPRDDLYF